MTTSAPLPVHKKTTLRKANKAAVAAGKQTTPEKMALAIQLLKQKEKSPTSTQQAFRNAVSKRNVPLHPVVDRAKKSARQSEPGQGKRH